MGTCHNLQDPGGTPQSSRELSQIHSKREHTRSHITAAEHEHARPRLVHREPRKRGAFAWPCPSVRAAHPSGRGAALALRHHRAEGHPPNTEQETRNVPPLRCGASTSKHAPCPACLRWCVRSEHAAQPGSPRGKAGITHAWGHLRDLWRRHVPVLMCSHQRSRESTPCTGGAVWLEESAVDRLGPCTSGG